MSLINLLQNAKAEKVAKSFKFGGTTYDFFVKVLTAKEVEGIGERQIKNKGKEVDLNFRSRMIAAAVVDEDGNGIPLNLALQMPNALSMKFWKCVAEVNDLDASDEEDAEGKPSPATTDAD